MPVSHGTKRNRIPRAVHQAGDPARHSVAGSEIQVRVIGAPDQNRSCLLRDGY